MNNNENYPVQLAIPVAWGEMDAFQHLNNVQYFRYFESVRIKYFEAIDFLSVMQTTGVGPILAATSCQFKKPVVYPDTLTAMTKVVSMKNSSFVMHYQIHSEKLGLVATGEAVLVTFDYKKGEKALIPEPIRKAIEVIEGKGFDENS